MKTEDYIPERPTLTKLRKAAEGCRGCDLYKNATQVVFGEGPRDAEIVIVGEQPGAQEDEAGHPFVGPSGKLLNEMLEAAGLDRARIYVTNAVKHFKFTLQGKRRLHQTPNPQEIRACHPWLDHELALLKPKVLVCMGATAARAVFGKVVTIKSLRGTFHETQHCAQTYVTNHPSALLRNPNPRDRDQAINDVIDDLIKVRKHLKT